MNPTQELFSAALEAGMREQAENLQLPPIFWSVQNRALHGVVLVGQVSRADYPDDEIEGVLRQWAEHLGLERQAPEVGINEDTASYHGEPDGIGVEVWGVIDAQLWEARCAEAAEQYRREWQGT